MGFFRGRGGGGGGSGGSGGLVNFINPQADYAAADVRKFLAENGTFERVETFHHEGHAKTVGLTASPGLWISLGRSSNTADGNPVNNGNALDEGGGSGNHFRGWHHRASDVSNPQDGDFYVSVTYGDFEVYRDGTGTGVSGWYGHNPFQPGEYWASVPNPAFGGDNPLDVSSDGAFDADSLVDAFNHATRVGEAFVIKSARLIVVAGAFSAAQSEYTRYEPRPYLPNKRRIVQFWGHGQSAAFPLTFVDRSRSAGMHYRYRFAQEEPISITRNGGIGVRAINAADVPAYRDLLASTETLLDQQILRFEPGLYHILFYDISRTTADTSFGGFLYRLQPGNDVLLLQYSSGYSVSSLAPPLGPDIRLGHTIVMDQMHSFDNVEFLTFIGSSFATETAVDGITFLRIEKIN